MQVFLKISTKIDIRQNKKVPDLYLADLFIQSTMLLRQIFIDLLLDALPTEISAAKPAYLQMHST